MGRTSALPKGVLVDLDDTILDDSGGIVASWQAVCAEAATLRPGIELGALSEAMSRHRNQFWADAERHRVGRQHPLQAYRIIVRAALLELGFDMPELTIHLADCYRRCREERQALIPGAIQAVERFKAQGSRLALITNGSAEGQRGKIERFGLARYFDRMYIEGELPYGKPDHRVYRDALSALGCPPQEAWSIGDNLEWDVAAPQRLGVYGIWIDARGAGVPLNAPMWPDHIVRSIAELP